MSKPPECQECGSAIIGRRSGQGFCKPSCRQAFNNRRMQRGAELYDLFRALRRERGVAKEMNLWTQLCRLELSWQQQDDAERPGRRSYMPPAKAITNLLDRGSLQRGEVLNKSVAARPVCHRSSSNLC